MPRVSKPLQISKEERTHLSNMLDHVDAELGSRIRIILACAEESNNKKVAQTLNVTEHTVQKWKEAYRQDGLNGLQHAQGTGRKAKNQIEDLKDKILAQIALDEHEWTVHSLASAIGASDYQVSKVLKEENISLTRKHSWSFPTEDITHHSSVATLGLYLSASQCAVLGGWYSYGIETDKGTMETRSRDLASKMNEAGYTLSMQDAMIESTYYEAESTSELSAFIRQRADECSASQLSGVKYILFYWSETPVELRGILPPSFELRRFEDRDVVLQEYHSWVGSLANSTSLFHSEVLIETIKTFYEKRQVGTEPFVWSKTIKTLGEPNTPIHDEPPVKQQESLSLESLLNGISQVDIDADGVQAGFIAFVKDKNGFNYQVVINQDAMPGADAFGFDSEEAFLNGMNQLERKIISLRDQAGLAETELYIETVKKNDSR